MSESFIDRLLVYPVSESGDSIRYEWQEEKITKSLHNPEEDLRKEIREERIWFQGITTVSLGRNEEGTDR